MFALNWRTIYNWSAKSNQVKIIDDCFLKVKHIHNISISDEEKEPESNKQKAKNKSRKSKKVPLLNPSLPKSRLKTIEHISSIVPSTQELSCLTMNRQFELTGLHVIPFPKINRSLRHAYFNQLHPLVDFLSDVDLNVVELNVLPPRYDWINMHLKSVVMLLIGMFTDNPANPRLAFASRSNIGKTFDLNVEKTGLRKCSKDLVTEIVTSQSWNGREIHIPNSILTSRDEDICYTERLSNQQKNNTISPETADALVQAIGFWDYVNKISQT